MVIFVDGCLQEAQPVRIYSSRRSNCCMSTMSLIEVQVTVQHCPFHILCLEGAESTHFFFMEFGVVA